MLVVRSLLERPTSGADWNPVRPPMCSLWDQVGGLLQVKSRIIADGMLRINTPVEYYSEYDLYVKREDLACPPPGPPFSKTRGVYAHIKKRPEKLIGVLDTFHSQAGHAVARACQVLGKKCINFWPRYKADPDGLRLPQQKAAELGADPWELPAGRSCILYHAAKKETEKLGGYMMPNALKLEESIEETAKECPYLETFDFVLIPASSGTIAAGVVKGQGAHPVYIIHMGYSRSVDEVRKYIRAKSGDVKEERNLSIIDEGYAYKDQAKPGPTPPWPCNEYYDLKAFRWLMKNREQYKGRILLWNIG